MEPYEAENTLCNLQDGLDDIIEDYESLLEHYQRQKTCKWLEGETKKLLDYLRKAQKINYSMLGLYADSDLLDASDW